MERARSDVVVTSALDSGAGSLREALSNAPEGQVIGFAPSLAGAVIELQSELVVPEPVTMPDRGRPFDGSLFADPKLRAFSANNGTWLYPLASDSPARDAGVSPSAATDQRGATRDAKPDIGPYEVGASCKK